MAQEAEMESLADDDLLQAASLVVGNSPLIDALASRLEEILQVSDTIQHELGELKKNQAANLEDLKCPICASSLEIEEGKLVAKHKSTNR